MATQAELMAKLSAARTTAIRAKAAMSEYTEKTVETVATIGGGALAGYIESEWPGKEVFGVNMGLAAGALLTVTGIMDWGGKQSVILGAAGEGMLAYEAGRRVANRASSSGVGALGSGASYGRLGGGSPISLDQVMRAIQRA